MRKGVNLNPSTDEEALALLRWTHGAHVPAHRGRKQRDYDLDLFMLKRARIDVLKVRSVLRLTGARQSKKKCASLLKSIDGALRNAQGHANREREG